MSYKKLILTSTLVLGTLASVATPAVASAATDTQAQTQAAQTTTATNTQTVNNSNTDNKSNIIAGSNVKKADTTVAHSTAATANVQAASAATANNALSAVVQSSATSATSDQQQAFLAMAAPMAQQAAAKYNVYASVMLAQAILESAWGQSDLATQGNNLFGIKGDYNGAYVSMPTSEWSASQGWYQIYANFRKYPSYLESFNDNGNKLRNGVDWDSTYYRGTWKENAATYKDATAWLQGRYATAPNYAESLNNVIQTYNLTQYDSAATQNATQAPSESTKVINVNNNNSYAVPLVAFNDNGTISKSNRGLSNGTPWATDQTKTYKGHTYYRVSTNEWVEDTYATLQ
ncbi:glycoside hydrolase family 73 protein [Companilactobacillus sp.]|jgi:flagellum-specific peptidoglycan hydrolase FlgJ|uniref:glycoside hydrolase family 73 protein n=1 Tax=Companilactobacillus sp. TaxID=2767905 RepID=UPI0025C1F170|nr:glycoside hydrolase family 73 protein [Companilactobacillus sp.]MCH4009178.1 glycoside hydrolase family 73 protein [Companilactobacillus sp.]MCH4050643.1 glycoside hydrolase family 73 protein [Companilactobacillus sp.]MCH4077120.1 glycoside hydrolase family 73 protein [Companilactobacillus sp.]MCH4125696.1 glycoside hydrolase family 73 protein [Companilactobacillus sp.]MCI1311405.1 glycoside hydrolase family 73 protein [Companilactobacillus sp.]